MDLFMSLGSVALQPGNFILWLIVGGLAGWITGRLMGGGHGFIGDILLGLIGAVVGGWIAGLLFDASFGFIGTLIVAIIGSVVLTLIWRAVTHGRGHAGRAV